MREFRTALARRQQRGRPVSTVTADIDDRRLTMHLRWQALPAELGGAGVDPLSLSVASIFNPQNLITDVQWRAQRLKDVEYKGKKRGVVATVADQQALFGAARGARSPHRLMLRSRQSSRCERKRSPVFPGVVDKHGSPLQRITDETDLTVLSEELVAIIRSGDVAAICKAAEARYRQFATTIEPIMDRTRDSWEPVMDMLKEDRPMDLYWQCVLRGREFFEDEEKKKGWYFNDLRDQLLMEMFGTVYFRARTMTFLTYLKDNSGNLRIDGNTILLSVEPPLFKNRRSKARFGPPAKPRPYERELPDLEGSHAMLRDTRPSSSPATARGDRFDTPSCGEHADEAVARRI